MLRNLHIQNYALISELDIHLSEGMTVLTGETGAGKSIILGALALVLGGRADLKTISDGADKCIIEAEFDECVVRRELMSNGKSRSFVDDSLVTLQELKELSHKLIDIHSQHATLLIEDPMFQLQVVDALAQNQPAMEAYTARYNQFCETRDQLRALQDKAKRAQTDHDYLRYRFDMLDEADLGDADELSALEEEHYQLTHAEDIRQSIAAAQNALDGDDGSALDRLRACQLGDISPELQERIDNLRIELQDIVREVNRLEDRIDLDPRRLEWVEERLSTLHNLLRKFGCDNLQALITERDQLGETLCQMDSFDHDIAVLQKQLDTCTQQLTAAADHLRETRLAVCPAVCDRLKQDMQRLGVKHANIDIQIADQPEFGPAGRDDVQFLFAANLNQQLRRVGEVASGGEASRLMLCIKSLIASTQGLPTIIFDEIDTGISGEIAQQMGSIMREMADSRQIIAITHLPQIAACGQQQWRVYKADTDTRTETHIRLLSPDERLHDIAVMLSGEQPTPAALETAKQLLNTL